MLTPDLLHEYQKKAVNFQCTHPNSMLWLDMGLGKTIVTLTTLSHLIRTQFLTGVIIVAPIRVCRLVWRQEAAKWEHTKHLTFSVVMGDKDQRTRALLRPANIYLINFENLGWLAETLHTYFVRQKKALPFNGIVWDEISKMKNSSTNRVKATKKILQHFAWSTGLTGTPASNGYKDLHGQFLVVDRGVRLGESKTAFKHRFYRKIGPYKEVPYDDTETTIKGLIGDITLEMSAEDYNPLPDLMINDVNIEMPAELRGMYDEMEKNLFLQLDNGVEKEMFNQASLTNTCLQFSNGSIYPVAGMPLWEPIHSLKLDALEDIVDEAQGSPILCSYAYRSDAARIMERFKSLNPINLTECKSEKSLVDAMARWKRGECPLMIGHAACLHPETQVLTERYGWVRIVDVTSDDLVFDGVEFVRHSGCSYSGYKDVIDVMGITMTPDHKLLINGQWVEAKDVRDTEEVRQEALHLGYKTTNYSSGTLYDVRKRVGDAAPERNEEQSGKPGALRQLHQHHVSQDDQHSHLANLAGDDVESERPDRQELRGKRYFGMPGMGIIRAVLSRYALRVFGRFDNRANRRKWSVLCEQLSMGIQHGTTVQQAEQSLCDVPGRTGAFGGTDQAQRVLKDDADHETQSGDDRGRSGAGLRGIGVREESESGERKATGKAHVYDLVDCGPRHQFVIKNDKDEVFISHNSMGHGIDGLQDRGHTLVWFGLNWSLDLYDQFNARVRRQGQGAPVICHRIMMIDTLDQAQALALDEKATTQTSLRKAVKEYRQSRKL